MLQYCEKLEEKTLWQALCNRDVTDDFIIKLVKQKIDSIVCIDSFSGWMSFRSSTIVDILMDKFAPKEKLNMSAVIDDKTIPEAVKEKIIQKFDPNTALALKDRLL